MSCSRIPRLCFLILLQLLLCGEVHSQAAARYAVLFEKVSVPDAGYRSEVFKMDRDQRSLPFIGVSAYCLDRSVRAQLSYRILRDDRWTDWIAFHPFTEGELTDRVAYEGPPIVPNIQAIQFKADRPVDEEMVFRLYFPSSGKKGNETGEQKTKSREDGCNCERPAVCDRECWCPSGDCPPDPTPVSTTPTHFIIHHSASFNASANFPAVVAYYWDLHVNTNGWDDIGYNWLIDAEGTVYEGRGDGRLGAHFSCMNGATVGICLIGNFQEEPPSPAALDRLREWLAWESCDKGVDLLGISEHHPAELVLRHVSGHRDGNASTSPNSCARGTVCPGELLYEQLNTLAAEADTFACLRGAPDLVIQDMWTDPAAPAAGDSVDLYVSLKNVGAIAAPAIRWDYRVDGENVGMDTLAGLEAGETRTRVLENYIFAEEGVHDYCIYADAVEQEPNSANNSFCREVFVSGTSDLSEARMVDWFRVYPNPSGGLLRVSGAFRESPENCEVWILNALGQAVYHGKEHDVHPRIDLVLDLSPLPGGTYYLQVRTSLGAISRSIVLME